MSVLSNVIFVVCIEKKEKEIGGPHVTLSEGERIVFTVILKRVWKFMPSWKMVHLKRLGGEKFKNVHKSPWVFVLIENGSKIVLSLLFVVTSSPAY